MTFCGCVGSFVGVLSLNSRLSSYAKRGRKVIREMSGHIGDLSSEQELTLKKASSLHSGKKQLLSIVRVRKHVVKW